MKKHLIFSTAFAMAFALVVAMVATGCSPQEKRAAAPPPPVLVAKSFTTNVPVQIDPPPIGHVTAYSTVTIHSQIQGMISKVHFQEGQEVKKGDPLFTIDPRPSQAALAVARANLMRDRAQLENAKIQFDREQKLLSQKLVSQDDYDTTKASMDELTGTVRADEAAVTNAELNLGFCQIRSPIDGKTGALQAFVGNVVKAPDDTLLTINQIHPIYVAFSVPEQYLPEIQKQMRSRTLKASVSYENMDGPPPRGELTFVNNMVDESTGTIQLRATFPNQNNALWPGQFVEIKLTLSELTNAVVVPSQAVQTGQNGEYVYVVKSDQTVAQQPISAGIAYEGDTVVKKGLSAGETVVTDGQLRLTPGIKVNIKSSTHSPPPNSAAKSS
jgi:membrane fusion protein, multidrug efflux system